MDIKKFIEQPYVDKIFSTLRIVAEESGAEVCLVGGAVRDLLLGKQANDMDFVVLGCPYNTFAELAAKKLGRKPVFFKQNVRIPYKSVYFDVSEPRGTTLAEDLALRDFTINNLALSLDGDVIGDVSDLKKGLIRPAYARSLDDDPLRILRGFRQAAALGFELTEEFLSAAKAKAGLLSTVAAERKGAELRKLVKHPDEKLYTAAQKAGVWRAVLNTSAAPSLLLQAARAASDFPPDKGFAFFLAILGREAFLTACKRLALNSAEIKYAKLLTDARLDTDAVTESVWRYRDDFDYVLAFFRLNGADPALIRAHEEAFREMDFAAAELVGGEDILSAAGSRKSGKWVGDLLKDTKIKLATGLLKNREEALKYIREAVNI